MTIFSARTERDPDDALNVVVWLERSLNTEDDVRVGMPIVEEIELDLRDPFGVIKMLRENIELMKTTDDREFHDYALIMAAIYEDESARLGDEHGFAPVRYLSQETQEVFKSRFQPF